MPELGSSTCKNGRLSFDERREAINEAKEIYLSSGVILFTFQCKNEDCKNVGKWHLHPGVIENDLSLVAIQNASLFDFYERMKKYKGKKKTKRQRIQARLQYASIESWENEGGAING